jgi:hypothetical protein
MVTIFWITKVMNPPLILVSKQSGPFAKWRKSTGLESQGFEAYLSKQLQEEQSRKVLQIGFLP